MKRRPCPKPTAPESVAALADLERAFIDWIAAKLESTASGDDVPFMPLMAPMVASTLARRLVNNWGRTDVGYTTDVPDRLSFGQNCDLAEEVEADDGDDAEFARRARLRLMENRAAAIAMRLTDRCKPTKAMTQAIGRVATSAAMAYLKGARPEAAGVEIPGCRASSSSIRGSTRNGASRPTDR